MQENDNISSHSSLIIHSSRIANLRAPLYLMSSREDAEKKPMPEKKRRRTGKVSSTSKAQTTRRLIVGRCVDVADRYEKVGRFRRCCQKKQVLSNSRIPKPWRSILIHSTITTGEIVSISWKSPLSLDWHVPKDNHDLSCRNSNGIHIDPMRNNLSYQGRLDSTMMCTTGGPNNERDAWYVRIPCGLRVGKILS